jgi:hypothetical protein
MLNLAEYRRTVAHLADFLPWAALVAPGVVLNKDGSFQRTARFRGPDLDSATPAELIGTTARLNNALRRLGSGWAIFVEAQRSPALGYPESLFPDPVSALVDAERKAQFEEEGSHFESSYFLTLVWLPPAEEAARAEGWLYEGRSRPAVDPRELLRGFVDRTDRLLKLLEGFVAEIAWLEDGETLGYLHSTVSTRRQRVRVPETPMYLDAILADEPLVGGLEPRLGSHHLRTLTVTGFPTATFPGILDELNRLTFPYRWSTRAILLDKTDATRLLMKIRRQWFAKRKSVAAILKEVMTNEASTLLDTDAANKAVDADEALQELGADQVGEAFVTATVTVSDENAGAADEKLRLVEKVVQGRDFTCMPETVNAVEAWLGSLPGHVYANVRQPPISTLNLAHMMPLSAVWAGPERDEHLGAPPLFRARTDGSPPLPLLAPRRRRRPHPRRRSDRRRQVRAPRLHGPAVPALSRQPGLRLRFRRLDPCRRTRHGWRLARSRWGAHGRPGRSCRPAAARPYRRSRRARLGRGLDRGHPRPRGRRRRPGSQGARLDGADLARLGAGAGAYPDRSRRPPAVLAPQAGPAALLPRRRPRAAARRRGRESRRRLGPGLRDRGPRRHGRGARRARLSLPPHRRPARRLWMMNPGLTAKRA